MKIGLKMLKNYDFKRGRANKYSIHTKSMEKTWTLEKLLRGGGSAALSTLRNVSVQTTATASVVGVVRRGEGTLF